MRKNFGSKTWLYPMPVLIVGTYDENGTPNAMNAAWGGIYDTGLVMVCLADDHKTTENTSSTDKSCPKSSTPLLFSAEDSNVVSFNWFA